MRGQAGYGTLLAWHPPGSRLTFESSDGWLRSIEVASGHTEDLVRGAAPVWSADGSLLAYLQGEDSLALYRPASGESAVLFRRRFWQSGLVGPIHWHPDGTYVSVNAFSGLTGKDLRCLVSDVRTGETFSVYEG